MHKLFLWLLATKEPGYIGQWSSPDQSKWQINSLSCDLPQIAAYEREIGELKEDLLKEIGHLEERKEEAVRAAATCSAEHFQNLQDQFFSELYQRVLIL